MRNSKTVLRKLTAKGMDKLEKDLEQIKENDILNPHIMIDKYESEAVKNIYIDKNKIFEDKLSVGKYFARVFSNGFQPCIGVWNWLAVFYYKQLLNSRGAIGELQRLFVPENFYRYNFRHLLKGPSDVCMFYKKNKEEADLNEIRFLLMDKVNVNGEFYRRFVERPDMRKNLCFIQIAKMLFYDEETKGFKKNFNVKEHMSRLIKVWKQYERSFDMYRMPSEEIVNKLLRKHDEFLQFIR